MGPAGAQGNVGDTGAQGPSMAGPAGPAGPPGPVGAQGYTGETGPQGATLVGPTGRNGRVGDAGAQGPSGQTGDRGFAVAGVAGNAGPSGYQGVQGEPGQIGAQGVVGVVADWTAYREFHFDRGTADLRSSEMGRISEIAAYLARNRSLELGIDGVADGRNPNLNDRRVASVREALMQAGVPGYQIRVGTFANPDVRRYGQVEVLLKTRA
jgi:outer membrane protein OmpA-like peptidoglycan-associated protein